MSLIEYLHGDDCEEVFRGFFEDTLEVLKHDPYRLVGSAVDDLRSWFAVSGVNGVRILLNNQMDGCRFSPERKLALNNCLEQLLAENQETIQELIDNGTIRNIMRWSQ